MFGFGVKPTMVSPADALPGRPTPLPGLPDRHEVLGTPLRGPWETGSGPAHVLYLAFGCFWGAERIMWKMPGVVSTAAGYMGGYTPNPTYDEVCSGRTGHAETVLVAYDPAIVDAAALLKVFWENHDPTQGMRQGNDVGTQYRSAAYWTTSEQEDAVRRTAAAFEKVLLDNGNRPPTTELKPAGDERTPLATEQSAGAFFYAEDYHQQYLHKNPAGYCSHGPNGLTCPLA